MISREHIEQAFLTLEAAGIKPPSSYATKPGRDAAVGLYHGILQHLDAREFGAAVVAHVADPAEEGKWWPRPGRLLSLTPAYREIATASAGAEGAWETLLRLRGSLGPDGYPRLWEHWPAAEAAPLLRGAVTEGMASVGGWHALGNVSPANPAPPRTFCAAYRAALARVSSEGPRALQAASRPAIEGPHGR